MNGSQQPTPESQTQQVEPAQPAQASPQQPPRFPLLGDRGGLPQDPRAKSPALACFLSAMPGLGQVYTGYYARGFVHAITVASIIALLATGDTDEFAPLLGIFLAFFWLYNIVDAGRRAAFYNQVLAGGGELDAIPPQMKITSAGGSAVAGLALVVIGAIALSYTRFDMSLRWLEDWWPLAPILGGVYLIALELRDRGARRDKERRGTD